MKYNKIEYNKLVRDKIPEIIRKSGGKVRSWKLDDDDYLNAILAKFTEEFLELKYAKTISGRAEELADIYEIFMALKHFYSISWREISHHTAKKNSQKGTFVGKTFLRDVKMPIEREAVEPVKEDFKN